MDVALHHRQLAGTATALQRAWLTEIARLRAANPVDAIAQRLHTAEPVQGLDATLERFAAAERDAFTSTAGAAAADATAQLRALVRKKTLDFDDAAPEVMSWAERNRLDLIRGIGFEQRSLIRYALSVASETGENPRVTAVQIRDAIGLTEEQELWVRNYRAQLERGQYAAALQRQLSSGVSDRSIAGARDAARELTPQQIDLAVERYRGNALSYRAEVIARTESQRIVNQGIDAAYAQGIRRGDLQAEQLECGWVATPGPRTRDTHAAMHGQVRAWGEPFLSPSGALLLFPGDPSAPVKETANCRCGRTVRIVARAAQANAA